MSLLTLLRRRRTAASPVLVTSGLIALYVWNYAYSDAGMTTLATNGVRVAVVEDRSGNGNHATQASPASLGATMDTAAGGLSFNATNRFYTVPSTVNPNANAATICAVGSMTTPATTQSFADLGPNHLTPHIRASQLNGWKFSGYQATGLLPSTSTHVYHMSSGTTGCYLNMSGRLHFALLAATSFTNAGGSIGRGNGSLYWGGTLKYWAIYSRQLTAAEIAQNEAYFASLAGSGVTLTTPAKQVIFKGDSITAAAQNSTNFDSYPAQIVRNASPAINRIYNLGISSQRLDAMLVTVNTEVTALFNAAYGASGNIVALMAGTNDLANSRTGAQVYADLQPYAAAIHAAGGKIIFLSPIDRATTGLVAGWETQRQNLLTLLAGNSSFLDAYVNVSADATMGVTGTATNVTYFLADKTHPTDVGYAYLATLAQTAINTLVAA